MTQGMFLQLRMKWGQWRLIAITNTALGSLRLMALDRCSSLTIRAYKVLQLRGMYQGADTVLCQSSQEMH